MHAGRGGGHPTGGGEKTRAPGRTGLEPGHRTHLARWGLGGGGNTYVSAVHVSRYLHRYNLHPSSGARRVAGWGGRMAGSLPLPSLAVDYVCM